ncbi:unnamed protein product [Camellia sinensis]
MVQVQPQAPNAAGNQFVTTSLYVGDLEVNVTDSQLYDLFNQLGQVVSVRVCRDLTTRRSLGYGYVNYANPQDGRCGTCVFDLWSFQELDFGGRGSLLLLYALCRAYGIREIGALRAMDTLNFTPLNGKPIRIMYSHRDPSTRKSGAGNIFIKVKRIEDVTQNNGQSTAGGIYNLSVNQRGGKCNFRNLGGGFCNCHKPQGRSNLDKAIDHKGLHDTFSSFGNILSCKVATDSSGQSKGYGFVQYDSEDAAQKAIEQLNGMLLNDKQVYVGPFLRKQERDMAADKTKFTNVFVKNLSESTTEEDLKKIFGEFGTITSVVVMRDADGNSRCFGFINFENADDAAQSVVSLNGHKFDNKDWYVGKAQKKSERELELKLQFEQAVKEAADKSQGLNLYIKNLDDSIGDDKLKELFSPFGTISSCKVMRDPNGMSRGSGFVAFSTPEEASRALLEMNGKMVVSKPLYVAHAQRKEDRRARLQAQFSQMRPVAMAPSVTPRMPMYPPGGPGIGQQIFYGQAPPAIMPPQAWFWVSATTCSRHEAWWGSHAKFLHAYGSAGSAPGWQTCRSCSSAAEPTASSIYAAAGMHPRGRVYRYPPGRGLPDVSMSGVGGGMFSVPYDMGGMSLRDGGMSQPIPIGALASALANASPADQRTMLGENLYPLVEQLEPEMAAKVTGMLLEMDQTEVLHLLESPEALKAKVAEAMEVLRNVQQQQQAGNPADQLAALSLNDGLVS